MPGYDKSKVVGMSDQELDEFTCGVCQEIFNDPVVTQCCRQSYCKDCIEGWLTIQGNCPNDRKPLRITDLSPAPRFATNLIDSIKIKCDFEEKGCDVITTIGELTKHINNCFYKLENTCKTCGLDLIDTQDHNCIPNLISKNYNLVNENVRLQKENQELRKTVQTLQQHGISSVIESARNSINTFVVRHENNISAIQKEIIIMECKHAVLNNDNFETLCHNLCMGVINRSMQSKLCRGAKYWQVVAFSTGGGSSLISGDQFISIQFDKLIIGLFTPKKK